MARATTSSKQTSSKWPRTTHSASGCGAACQAVIPLCGREGLPPVQQAGSLFHTASEHLLTIRQLLQHHLLVLAHVASVRGVVYEIVQLVRDPAGGAMRAPLCGTACQAVIRLCGREGLPPVQQPGSLFHTASERLLTIRKLLQHQLLVPAHVASVHGVVYEVVQLIRDPADGAMRAPLCGTACHLDHAPISAAKQVLGGIVLKPGMASIPR